MKIGNLGRNLTCTFVLKSFTGWRSKASRGTVHPHPGGQIARYSLVVHLGWFNQSDLFGWPQAIGHPIMQLTQISDHTIWLIKLNLTFYEFKPVFPIFGLGIQMVGKPDDKKAVLKLETTAFVFQRCAFPYRFSRPEDVLFDLPHPWPLTWCLFASCLTPLREADLPGRAVASGVPVRRAGGGGVWRHQLAGARGGVVPRGPGDHRGPPQWVTPPSSLVGRPALESLAPARDAWLASAFSCLVAPYPPYPLTALLLPYPLKNSPLMHLFYVCTSWHLKIALSILS